MSRFKLWLVVTGTISILATLGGSLVWNDPPARPLIEEGKPAVVSADPHPASAFAGSAVCKPCHPAEHEAWSGSHHALAERPIEAARDASAFRPDRKVRQVSNESTLRERDGRLEIVTSGPDGRSETFVPTRVVGVAPFEQFVVPFPGGRFQVTSLAFDPAKNDWFDALGDGSPKPGDWRHWTSRGMTWSSRCAGCHVTDLRKGYDGATDTYSTAWLETGVGCEACHGPRARHAEEARRMESAALKPVRAAKLSPDSMLDTCGSCHAREDELTGVFVAGDALLDHFRPALPDETDAYYPDGQVREESFEHVSFLLSRMHGEGVRCVSCHEPHAGRLLREGNALCLECHKEKIDPGTHSHHDPSGAGGQCVGCHMPLTRYHERHERRDHAFTVPDPLLTREHGTPNACNRCHADRSTDWAIDAAEKWFGERLDRSTRKRARTVARARRGSAQAVPELIAMAATEKSSAWRAVATGLLAAWAAQPPVREALSTLLEDPEPLVRAAAVRALERAKDDREDAKRLLADPVRLVRIEAAWLLRRNLSLETRAGQDLTRHLGYIADQPQGALQSGLFHLDRGNPKGAKEWIRKAIAWDPASAPNRQALALVLESQGNAKEAVSQLAEACKLAPRDAEYPFALGLAQSAADSMEDAVRAFETACELDPRFARAWYNLGLARSRLARDAAAIDALRRAQAEDPDEPEYPFARAALHLRRKEIAEAREAALEALKIDPELEEAADLLAELNGSME